MYREIRIENTVANERGENAKLKEGADVDVIVEADSKEEARGKIQAVLRSEPDPAGVAETVAGIIGLGPPRGSLEEAFWAVRRLLEALAAEVGYASPDRGVKSDLAAGKPYGHFFGLRGPVPSALVENLFLSNPDESALLRDDATLDALADGCAQGVLEYLAGAPPAAADGLE